MSIDLWKTIENIKNTDKDEENIKISSYIINNINIISNLSITKIAKDCETSPTKITRYAHKIGLNGFSELKLRLSDFSKTILIDGYNVDVKGSITKQNNKFMDEYMEIHKRSFEKQFNYLKSRSIDNFTNLINNSKRVFLFAFNLSYNISKNFCQRLKWYNVDIISECDYISIQTFLNLIDKNDLVILLSISGKNNIINEIADKMSKKTNLIGLVDISCNFKDLFDDYLVIDTDEDKLWNINSVKAQLMIQLLDYIFINWVVKNKKM
ncbi:RpiR family transcriptional regulator [Spiroplasma litorale]|uniref:RpiR family transcriptional regulator n=1 Tax=Spiroplasma litorale TaxID=216942 RepID=A0A0K1W1W4_9MOLU|nr:MurR/RpiR family transcriptional regulator [Spiroplasma litorale]AKX34299.1 RpiR family transcriptional regulator [Spiroplasma litorale]